MTIKLKLALGFFTLVLLIGLLGLYSNRALEIQSHALDKLIHEDLTYYQITRQVTESLLLHNRHTKMVFLNMGNQQVQENYAAKIKEQSDIVRPLLDQLAKLTAEDDDLGSDIKRIASKIQEHYREYYTGLSQAVDQAQKNSSLTPQQADALMDPYKKAVLDLEAGVDKLAAASQLMMRTVSEKTQKTLAKEKNTLAGVAIGGIILAALLAAGITLSITRPLARIVGAVSGVARGDFDQSLDVERKDEIGHVARSIKNMVTTTQDALKEMARISRSIREGHLTQRGDATKFQGEFSRLILDTNTLADALVGFFDSLPTPVMAIDNDFNILYMNTAGAKVGGTTPGKLAGSKCFNHFRTGDCNSDKCACRQAMRSRSKKDSSTRANPGGIVNLDIDYIAVPILDGEGKVKGAFEIVLDQTQVRAAQRQILAAADNTAAAVDRLSSAAEELSAQVEQSSRGADEQRAMTIEAATAMEEMNATVMEVARNASSAAASADDAKNHAQNGEHMVEQVVKAIGTIQTHSSKLTENIHSLGMQAAEIGKVMTVITDIADQTNLLALNAAIEAARAGDAGRGFAVVADEVRKLAEKTMLATKEVGDAITSIQKATETNVRDMAQTEKAVHEGTGLAEQAGQALGDIVRIVEATADQVRNIATASEEQSAASEQISRSVDAINRISSETADAMGQSARAITELADLAGQLSVLVGDMRA